MSSSPSPPSNLSTIATLLKATPPPKIVVLAGAGISTAANVPDFRSAQTGLYAKLAPLKLPYPEAIFDINFFKHTPEPFYAIARARKPRNLRPTLTHAFLALLAKKDFLHFVFTQNIDGLEEDAGVPASHVLPAHGNWKSQRCYRCKRGYPDELMEKAIETGEVPYCLDEGCVGVVKPDVVFFGQDLPREFEEKEKTKLPEADVMLVLGTSLKVAPCARLPRGVREGVPRVLINLEPAGDIGNRHGDVVALGQCDEVIRALSEELGWAEELNSLWKEAVAAKARCEDEQGEQPSLDELIARCAEKIGPKPVTDGHRRMLEEHLGAKFAGILPGKV
ncbi:hypothetical protein SI65_02310 [Aspergillus cristatus]|uniref:NAD-dependent protein deacetylase n=1 Tax=Aspergillus cristatus TaxID=573508 RepID=A0A1E3BM44_ASPCR|nr:hypothetical protein SI65_02310 [Aspergillus cristatus]